MARWIDLHPRPRALDRTPARDRALRDWLTWTIENTLSARAPQEAEWMEARRQYTAVPRTAARQSPAPSAVRIEVPLGAIDVDAQYAAALATLFNEEPVLTALPLDQIWVPHAKALQRWVNYASVHEMKLREAMDHSFFDVCQLGTGAAYTPFVEEYVYQHVWRKGARGPRIFSIEPQDLLLAAGSTGDIERDPFVAIRAYLWPSEMRLRQKFRGWDISKAVPISHKNFVRQKFEALGLTQEIANSWHEQFEVWAVYCYFDYHGDGTDLDLLVYYDRGGQALLDVQFNPYDERPISIGRYQIRPHLGYGLGIMAMVRPIQDELTELHNQRLTNMLLANNRMWIARPGVFKDSQEIWPSRVIETADVNAVKPLQLGDVYPSSAVEEQMLMQLAERRIGGLSAGITSTRARVLGTRTPATTALSAVQQDNQRFLPAFDQMRFMAAHAVRQGLLRYRERIMQGDADVESRMAEVLGPADAALVVEVLRQPEFHRYVAVEFTAISPITTRAAQRQAALQWGQMLQQYYEKLMTMLAAVAAPGVPPVLVDAAAQVARKSSEAMDRFLRTFDTIRDPQQFLLDLDAHFAALASQAQAPPAQPAAAEPSQGGGGPAGPTPPPLGSAPGEGGPPPEGLAG